MAIEDNHHANEAIKAIQILTQRHANDIKYLREQYDRIDAQHQIAEKMLEEKEKNLRDCQAIIAGNRMDQIKSMAIGFFIGALGVALIFYIMYTWS